MAPITLLLVLVGTVAGLKTGERARRDTCDAPDPAVYNQKHLLNAIEKLFINRFAKLVTEVVWVKQELSSAINGQNNVEAKVAKLASNVNIRLDNVTKEINGLKRKLENASEDMNSLRQKMDEDQTTLINTMNSLKDDMMKEIGELKQNMSADHQRLAVIPRCQPGNTSNMTMEIRELKQNTSAEHQNPTEASGCIPGYTSTTYGCYKVVESEEVSWEVAKTRCEDDGAHLVSLQSSEEGVALGAMMTSQVAKTIRDGYWTSGKKISGVWRWTSEDSPFSYYNWRPGQPEGNDGEDCVYMWYDPGNTAHHLKWGDYYCTGSYHYICEV